MEIWCNPVVQNVTLTAEGSFESEMHIKMWNLASFISPGCKVQLHQQNTSEVSWCPRVKLLITRMKVWLLSSSFWNCQCFSKWPKIVHAGESNIWKRFPQNLSPSLHHKTGPLSKWSTILGGHWRLFWTSKQSWFFVRGHSYPPEYNECVLIVQCYI